MSRGEWKADPLVGRSLGEYVLREKIGQGGFGAVYRAIQPTLDREAVIKVLHSRLHTSPAATERFLREAKLASKLDHPYAAHIYGFGAEKDGELWIAMELVRGTPLDRLLEIQGPFPLERFVPLLDRLCEVVHTAHEQGIVHRDLKPANVMVLSRAGRMLPKLLDLGIAKGLQPGEESLDLGDTITVVPELPVESADTIAPSSLGAGTPPGITPSTTARQSSLTQHGAIMGSPFYMAPEQWMDAAAVDGRADIYALAILAYEVLTGKPPFAGGSTTELAKAHASQLPPPLGRGLPPALDQVLAKALAKRPSDRYADALEFAAAFRHASGLATEATSVPVLEARTRTWATTSAPQPIAEAVGALDAARNAHQARNAAIQLARTVVRYLGLLALACRSRVGGRGEPAAVAELLRTLYHRPIGDRDWLALAQLLTQPWRDRRDAYPIPELVGVFHDAGALHEDLEAVAALRDRELPSEAALPAELDTTLRHLARVLDGLAFVGDYLLAVTRDGRFAERWMGLGRTQRTTISLQGAKLPPGTVALLDHDGVPIVSLSPLVQVAAPTPGAPLELFLFEGRDQRGARLVALPAAFEHHDDELWAWFRMQLDGSLDDGEAAVLDAKAPYRGLAAFSAADGALFFGREKLVDAFLNRLRVIPLLAVVGRSGAGKSSFVHAGVLPALEGEWRVIALRPGPSPLATLAARLAHAEIEADVQTERGRSALADLVRADAARRGPVLVVVDQLEELFTLCASDDDRRGFSEVIASLARAPDDPVRVVFTLRDDFLVRTEQLPALKNRLAQGLQLLTVPAADDLRRILVEPARRSGYEFEDAELPAAIVREVADQPGALALISFTAERLWELRDRAFRQLTRAAYQSLGGVGGALAQHAETTLQAMLPEEQALTREAMRHLVTSQGTRAVLRRSELRQLLGGGDHADRVIEKLVAARLLVASEDATGAETVELVHEALLSAWPRLAEWRREDAEGTRFHEQLRSAGEQWNDRHRDKGLLWRGDALVELRRWRSRHAVALTENEAAFAAASETEATRGRRNRRVLLAAAFAALAGIVVVLVVSNARITRDRGALRDNLERQFEAQGRQLVLQDEPLRALAYLAKAAELGATGPAHDFLVAEAVSDSDGELFEVRHGGKIRSAQFSHDGQKLVTAANDNTAVVWDASGHSLATLQHTGYVTSAAFSLDDKTVLTASDDGTAIEWDAVTGQTQHRFTHTGAVTCATYSPDGTSVLTTGADDRVVVWNALTGAERFHVTGDGAGMSACAYSADGAVLAAADRRGVTRLWDGKTGAPLRELRGDADEIASLHFAPHDLRIVTVNARGAGIEWDGGDGKRLLALTSTDTISSAEFSPDGKRILTTFDISHVATEWDAQTGAQVHVLAGHSASVLAATYSRDGRYIVTTSEDATAQLWDAHATRRIARWVGHRDFVVGASFDARGERVVTVGDDDRALVWHVGPQETALWLAGHATLIQSAAFSPDGTRAASSSGDGVMRVWDAKSGRLERTITVVSAADHTASGETWVNDTAFSPDGRTIATAAGDGVVQLWDAETGERRASWPTGREGATRLAFSPDGRLLAAGNFDGTIRCWEIEGGRVRFELHGRPVISVAFSPAGDRIATTATDNVVRIWDLQGQALAAYPGLEQPYVATFDHSGRHLLTIGRQAAAISNAATGTRELVLVGHTGFVYTASWSPDDTLVVTAASDGTARVWDARTGDELASYRDPGRARTAVFSHAGDRLMIGDDDGTLAIHDLPRLHLGTSELDRLLRCRVPFQLDADRLVQRPLDCR